MIAKAVTTIDRGFGATFGTVGAVARARILTVLGVEPKTFLQEALPRLFQKFGEYVRLVAGVIDNLLLRTG